MNEYQKIVGKKCINLTLPGKKIIAETKTKVSNFTQREGKKNPVKIPPILHPRHFFNILYYQMRPTIFIIN